MHDFRTVQTTTIVGFGKQFANSKSHIHQEKEEGPLHTTRRRSVTSLRSAYSQVPKETYYKAKEAYLYGKRDLLILAYLRYDNTVHSRLSFVLGRLGRAIVSVSHAHAGVFTQSIDRTERPKWPQGTPKNRVPS